MKACKPANGAQKSFVNSLFVGMTRNTGHRDCHHNNANKADNRIEDLLHVSTCGSDNGDDDLNSQNLYSDGKEVPGFRIHSYYFKPRGDVYRQSNAQKWYPTQGLSIYDTWLPHVIRNNTFIDYFSEEDDGFRHGLGVHLGNRFRLSAKNCFVFNNTYINTPRRVQTGSVSCFEPSCARPHR